MTDSEHVREEELELYALGGLQEDEAAALKLHLAACGECAMKLAQSRGSATLLSFAAKQEQPAGTIKAELMARLHARQESEERSAWPLPAKDGTETVAASPPSPSEPKTNPWWNWLLVPTAVALAMVSLALSWQNHRVTQAFEKELQLAESLRREHADTQKLITLLTAADTLTVKLAPAGETLGTGVVRYNGRMGVVAYSAQLPAAPAGKSYQMWLLPSTGAAINAGTLDPGSHSLGSVWLADVPLNTPAKAFAVTVEPAGGAPQPTGAKVLAGDR